MSSALHLFVRLVHVLAMAIILGGAAFAWQAIRGGGSNPHRTMRRFEWAFWGAIGLLVATGVGNLGALGPPGPSTRWGTVLTVKLIAVFAFLLLSIVRSLAVLQLGDADGASETPAFDRLRTLYAGTVWWLVLTVALAEVLAHG
jgi:uncharacterized membrane protein